MTTGELVYALSSGVPRKSFYQFTELVTKADKDVKWGEVLAQLLNTHQYKFADLLANSDLPINYNCTNFKWCDREWNLVSFLVYDYGFRGWDNLVRNIMSNVSAKTIDDAVNYLSGVEADGWFKELFERMEKLGIPRPR
jgi:hypothetical protein